MSMIHRVVLYQYVLAWSVGSSLLSCSSLHADTVVAGIDGVVHYQYVLAAADVEGVTVLCVPWAADGHSVHHHVCASGRDEVELWRILYRHSAHKHSVAVCQSYEVCSQALLCLWCVGDVAEMLQVERKPQFAAVGLCAAHLVILLPFHIAHLRTLHRAPYGTVAVDDSLSCDTDVLALAGTDER